jgi:hypothetical protein
MMQSGERRVFKEDDPDLYEHLESVMFSGGTHVELDGQTYNLARDHDERGNTFYVLTPEAEDRRLNN